MSTEPGGGVATLAPLRTSLAGGSPAPPPLRTSMSGAAPSSGGSAAPSTHNSGSKPRVSNTGAGGNPRMSSPGMLGNVGAPAPVLPITAPQHLPPMRALSTAISSNANSGNNNNNSSDLPRLTTRMSESGGKDIGGMKPSPPSLRRAATMVRSVDSGLSSVAGPGGGGAAIGAGRGDAIIKERRALQQDKTALVLNKKRLEALLLKAAEALPPSADEPSSSSVRGGGGGSLRTHIQKALDESGQLDKHMSTTPGGGMIPFEAEAEAKVKQLTAQLADMKLDHEVALSRLEGELKYRNTQSSAAASGLQKQLQEADEEVKKLRRANDIEMARSRDLTSQVQELQRQLRDVSTSLCDKTEQVKDMKDLMGMDKITMNTVLEMLRAQLKEAKAEAEAGHERVKELEYALVHRDTLLAEAQQKLHAAGLAGGAGGISGGVYEEPRVQSPPMDGKSAWSKLARAVAGTRTNRLASATGAGGRTVETAGGVTLVASSVEAPKGVLSA